MATVDYFLRIDGIQGTSTDAKHKNEIEIESFSWGLTQVGGGMSGGGGGAGKVSFQDLHFAARASAASPRLFLSCATGTHHKAAELSAVAAGDKAGEFMQVTLRDVLVTSYQTGGQGGGDVPIDQFSLNFAEIEIEFRTQNQDGSLSAPVKAGYDLKANTKI